MKNEQKATRNQFRRVFEYISWGGMPMATIAIHEDDFNEDPFSKKSKEELRWQNIRVEICVGGSCIGTTLDKIVDCGRSEANPKSKIGYMGMTGTEMEDHDW